MSKRILIVDDAAFMRMMIKDILSKNGFEVVGEAADGVQAIEKYHELKPDLVTMDITMPEMDGVTCLEEMIKRKPTTKIMIITALSDKGTGLKALKKGARGYLHKPITPEKLKDAFDKLLKRK